MGGGLVHRGASFSGPKVCWHGSGMEYATMEVRHESMEWVDVYVRLVNAGIKECHIAILPGNATIKQHHVRGPGVGPEPLADTDLSLATLPSPKTHRFGHASCGGGPWKWV